MRQVWILFGLLLLCIPVSIQADTTSPNCERFTTNGVQTLVPRFNQELTELTIVDLATANVISQMPVPLDIGTRDLNYPAYWSPNCAYLSYQFMEGFMIWHVEVGEVGGIVHGRLGSPGFRLLVHWHPTEQYALLEMRDDIYLWQSSTRSVVPLDRPAGLLNGTGQPLTELDTPPSPIARITWDDSYPVVLLTYNPPIHYFQLRDAESDSYHAYHSVFEFSLIDGEITNRYSLNGGRAYFDYVLSPDRTHIAVFTLVVGKARNDPHPVTLIVYNRLTSEANTLNVDYVVFREFRRGFVAVTRKQVAFSADNRYLVAGWQALRIWDLTQLSANPNDRIPDFRHDAGNSVISSIRFIDTDTIEVIDPWLTASYWHRVTGERINIGVDQ